MKVFLWGMPGSGKSTLGKKVAALLQLPFIDLDKLIEIQQQQTIASIFEQKGESYFRETEQQMLLSAIARHHHFLMATGGGAPCFFDNAQVMKTAGITIFLDMPMEDIARRMSKKGLNKRPLLSGLDQENMAQEFAARFQHRMPFYQQAHHIIKKDDMHPEHIASLVE